MKKLVIGMFGFMFCCFAAFAELGCGIVILNLGVSLKF